MEKNTENSPRLLLKSKIFTTPNVYVNSSNVGSSHFTIRVTDFSEDPNTCEQLSSNIILNDVSHSTTNIEPRQNSFKASPFDGNSSRKKRIKMSEEIPSKRVVLVLPNKSLKTLESNTEKQNDIQLINSLANKNDKKIIIPAKINQTTKEISDKINKLNGIESINSISKSNTNGVNNETQVIDISLQNDETHDSIISSATIKNSSTKINDNSIQQTPHLNTSIPKSRRNSPQVMGIKRLNNPKFILAQNLLATGKSMQTPSSSVSKQEPSIKSIDKTSLSKNVLAVLSPPSSSLSTETKKFIADSINPNSSLRQININGLTLKPINSGLLNSLKLQNRIKICDDSKLNGTSVNEKTHLLPTEISESLVTTTTVESPQKINQTNNNCEECSQLRSEVNAQLQTILDLKRDIAESILFTNKEYKLNYKTDSRTEDERHSEVLKELNDINKKLRDELKLEQFYNNKLKIGVSNRDRHIQELEYELVHVSKIFDEIKVKAISLKKLFNGEKR
ncbi:hypothetical protein PV325_010866 [Microctonus aethiopoides]|uniref:Uncharacterized protein n=1 Tax=Microctonus aethiopoides TaxID=144406 RepID=A0AA39C749_9HYME|nr:hypothetical protein PV325_010866 [Microctonus aethiopoides]KAK0159157.1 hypothetical protein PV328_010078 [Microctonus aethiopoides]